MPAVSRVRASRVSSSSRRERAWGSWRPVERRRRAERVRETRRFMERSCWEMGQRRMAGHGEAAAGGNPRQSLANPNREPAAPRIQVLLDDLAVSHDQPFAECGPADTKHGWRANRTEHLNFS